MTVQLFPRLDALAVGELLGRLDGLIEVAGAPLREGRLPAGTSYGAVGGTCADFGILADLRRLMLEAALTCGFPDRGTTEDRARFDSLAAAALGDFDPLSRGEGDRDDVWAFIATVLLPDVSTWRFHTRSAKRFHGGVRNVFQRLWMRAWALDGGPGAAEARWNLLETLTEDALVAITERPSIGADRRLSRAIARAWVATAEVIGRARMEDVMRRTVIDLRIRNEIQMLTALDDVELDRLVLYMFARTSGVEELNLDAASSVTVSSDVLVRRRAGARPAEAARDGKTSEMEIQHAILELMRDGQVWSNAELKSRLAKILPLTEADRIVGARAAEQLWENRVNNALGRARGNSLYAKGFVVNEGLGRHRLTEEGRRYMEDDLDIDALLAGLSGSGGDGN